MRPPGVEPRSPAWKAGVLPLDQERFTLSLFLRRDILGGDPGRATRHQADYYNPHDVREHPPYLHTHYTAGDLFCQIVSLLVFSPGLGPSQGNAHVVSSYTYTYLLKHLPSSCRYSIRFDLRLVQQSSIRMTDHTLSRYLSSSEQSVPSIRHHTSHTRAVLCDDDRRDLGTPYDPETIDRFPPYQCTRRDLNPGPPPCKGGILPD